MFVSAWSLVIMSAFRILLSSCVLTVTAKDQRMRVNQSVCISDKLRAASASSRLRAGLIGPRLLPEVQNAKYGVYLANLGRC